MGYDTGAHSDTSGPSADGIHHECTAKRQPDEDWSCCTGVYSSRNYVECRILYSFKSKKEVITNQGAYQFDMLPWFVCSVFDGITGQCCEHRKKHQLSLINFKIILLEFN